MSNGNKSGEIDQANLNQLKEVLEAAYRGGTVTKKSSRGEISFIITVPADNRELFGLASKVEH